MKEISYFTRRYLLGGLAVSGGALALATIGGAYISRSSSPKSRAVSPEMAPEWESSVEQLHARMQEGNFLDAAFHAGIMSDEAIRNSSRVLDSWLGLTPDHRGLLPRRLQVQKRNQNLWNYRDCAADNFCHLAIAANLYVPHKTEQLEKILAIEKGFDDDLPRSVDLRNGEIVDETVEDRIFGAVEYAKDGLLPMLERLGVTQWRLRLEDVVNKVMEASPVVTKYGRIPSAGAEKNGEFLQVLARLYQRNPDERLLAAGRAIADSYVYEVLPWQNSYVPADEWDFSAHEPIVPSFRLVDHGNEILSGLCEWVGAEEKAPDSRLELYAPHIRKMLEAVFRAGIGPEGTWLGGIPTSVEKQDDRPNDNWGYLTAAYVGFALTSETDPEKKQEYLSGAKSTVENTIRLGQTYWKDANMDSFADSVESGLYLLPHLQVEGLEMWIDKQAGCLMAFQQPDGFVIRTYLDGNFVRSSLLHASFRSLGAIPRPWRPGLQTGAVRHGNRGYFSIHSDAPWSGKLHFDKLRHDENLGLKMDYPRLNSWTEWYPLERERVYQVTKLQDGSEIETRQFSGTTLIDGLPLDYKKGRLQLVVEAV